jgi:hypothetical protein
VVFVVLLLGCIIKYPDTVDGQVSISAHNAPVRIVAKNNGRIHLLNANKSMLGKGTVIAYIESEANYAHILQIDSLLQVYNTNAVERHLFPDNLVLGEIGSI